jgi:hypothetical protein
MKELGWFSGKFDVKAEGQENGMEPNTMVWARLGAGSWMVLIVLLLLFAATVATIYAGWRLASGTDVPASGYAAMALGVIVSLAVGFGLMALIFYSSRKGYDEPPVLILPGGTGDQSDSVPETKNDQHAA